MKSGLNTLSIESAKEFTKKFEKLFIETSVFATQQQFRGLTL